MLDKDIIKSKFQKSILTYPKYASIQLEIAKKLADFIDCDYQNILEIGSYSGFLTNEIVKKIYFKSYTALDIIDSFDCIKNLSPKIKFILDDVENIEFSEKYDLIVSSSSLQWCNDFKSVIKKLKSSLNDNGRIMLAIFGNKNLFQIKEIFNISLDYPSLSDIRKMFSSNAIIKEEIKTIQFDSPYDILRHLKYTGVNSFKNNYTYSKFKEGLKVLENKFENKLTYNPLYIID